MDKEQIKNLYLNMYKAKSALNRYKLVHLVGLTLISGLVSYKVLPKSTQEEVPVTYKIDFKIDMNDTAIILMLSKSNIQMIFLAQNMQIRLQCVPNG